MYFTVTSYDYINIDMYCRFKQRVQDVIVYNLPLYFYKGTKLTPEDTKPPT